MAKSARISGADPADCIAALDWAAGLPGQRQRLAKPASFSNGAMWLDLVNAWLNRPDQQQAQDPVIATGPRVNDAGYDVSAILGGGVRL